MNYSFKLIACIFFLLLSTSCQSESIEIINVTTSQFNQIMHEHPEMMVLDIRTPQEFNAQHIEGAVNINFYDTTFVSHIEQLDKTKPILLHCRSGNRSSQSLAVFTKLEFHKIYHLNKGIVSGFPTRN